MIRILGKVLLPVLLGTGGWFWLFVSLESNKRMAWRGLYLTIGVVLILSGLYLAIF